MARERLSSKENLDNFMNFRNEKLIRLHEGKISHKDFSDATFNYFYQNKLKQSAKAHDVDAIIFNYFYWITQIERRAIKERVFIEKDLGSIENFYKITEMFVRRRDQMVRRLIEKLNLEVHDSYLVFGTTIEIIFKDLPYLFHCQKETLDKINLETTKIKKSKLEAYIPLLDIHKKITNISR